MDTASALRLILDSVDYTANPPNCRPTEMVAAVLPTVVIEQCRAALAEDRRKGLEAEGQIDMLKGAGERAEG